MPEPEVCLFLSDELSASLNFRAASAVMPSSRRTASGIGVGAPVSGSAPLETFGNAITWRMSGSPAMQRDEPLDPHREAAVRRRAHRERLEQEAELRLLPPRR